MRIDPRKCLTILYYLSENEIINKIASFTKISRKGIGIIFNKIENKIKKYWKENEIKSGGLGVIMQVDETKLNFYVKSHRGRSPIEPVWAVTITNTSTLSAKGYVEIVLDRSADALMSIINRIIMPGSIIHTNKTPHRMIKESSKYSHGTICNKYNFVDPDTRIHTQHVESFNNKLKLEVKKKKKSDV
ncbi:hypothetical protein DMUE_3457 [Dictyocoela muelleri]|nr:hypothetical protein DMUE_3457 [Dictyocoela muelleri]